MISWFRQKYQMICRFLRWGYRMRYMYEWDAHYIYKMIYLKLDDCRKNFNEHGHLMWNDDDDNPGMRKLRECSELAKRLYEDNYHMKPYYLMIEKYGRVSSGLLGREFKYRWEKIKTEKEDKLAQNEYLRLKKKHDAIKKADMDRFHSLLKYGIGNWWD